MRVGSATPAAYYLGATAVDALRLGANLVWASTPAPEQVTEPAFSGNFTPGSTITVSAGTYTNSPTVVTQVFVDFNNDDDSDAEITLDGSNQFVIPASDSAGYRYQIVETATTTGGSVEYNGLWSTQVEAVQITATVTPASSRLYDGQAVEDMTNYATMTGTGNFASTAGTISSAVVSFGGDAVSAGGVLSEGNTANFSVLVTDSAANTSTFGTTLQTVEYKARVLSTSGNEALIDVNPIVPTSESVSVTITGGAYAGTYGGISVGDIDAFSPPYAIPTTSSTTGSTPVGSTLTAEAGVWLITRGSLSLSYEWRQNGTPIVGAADQATYVTVLADEGAVISCAITGSDGTLSTTIIPTGVTVDGTTTWSITEGDTVATVNNYPAVPVSPAWSITEGDTVATVNTYPGQV